MQKLKEKKELALKTHQELLQQVEEDADRQARPSLRVAAQVNQQARGDVIDNARSNTIKQRRVTRFEMPESALV